MKADIFFPKLTRQPHEVYYSSLGSFYEDYSENYVEVAKDCHYRCVYCDATEKECGGDSFSLDHFRPRKIFSELFDGILNIHPYNLYLSCPKCNILKSSDWHGCTKTINGETYVSVVGYIDRFSHNAFDFLDIDQRGTIVNVNINGPVDYMIKKLLLNRPSRMRIRYKRLFHYNLSRYTSRLSNLTDLILEKRKLGELDPQTALSYIEAIQNMRKKIDSLNDLS